jgi:acyl carrier protein
LPCIIFHIHHTNSDDGNVDDKRLVSFVESKIISEKYLPTTSHDLQRLFTRCLPPAFVPTLVLIIDQLPMTTSGKVDRTKLVDFLDELFTKNAQTFPVSPKPNQGNNGNEGSSITSKEDEELESIKNSLLDLYKPILPSLSLKIVTDSNIYMKETFFSLGGDSMTAVEVLWKFKKKFNLTVPFDVLNQCIELQALTILRLLAESKVTSSNEIKKGIKRSFDWDDSSQLSQPTNNDADSFTIIRAATASNDSFLDDSKKKLFDLKESWHYQMSKCVDSSPLIVQSSSSVKLYIGDHSGHLIALDANTGSSFWEISIELHIESAAAINTFAVVKEVA